jgi:hypothetical protein
MRRREHVACRNESALKLTAERVRIVVLMRFGSALGRASTVHRVWLRESLSLEISRKKSLASQPIF